MIKTLKLELKIDVPNKIFNTKINEGGDEEILLNNKYIEKLVKNEILNIEVFSCSDENEDYSVFIKKIIKIK